MQHGDSGDATVLDPVSPPLQQNPLTDPMEVLKGLIDALVINVDDIIPRLGNSKISGARCTLSESTGPTGTIKTCTLQVSTLTSSRN